MRYFQQSSQVAGKHTLVYYINHHQMSFFGIAAQSSLKVTQHMGTYPTPRRMLKENDRS